MMTAPRRSAPPPLFRRGLLLLAAVAAILLVSGGYGAADPPVTPSPPPPVPTVPDTTAPPTGPTPPTAPAPAPNGTTAPATPAVPRAPVPPRTPDPQPGDSGESTGTTTDCGVTRISDCVAEAIDGFFRRLVDSALNPLMNMLSKNLLTTPDPSTWPQIGQLWSSSWQLMLAMYGLVVIAVGVLLMFQETLQTQWGWRELLPRLVVGFLAGALSMVIATEAIRFANALAQALAGEGVSTDSAVSAFKSMMHVGGGTATNLFVTLMLNALVVVLATLSITYVIRVVVTVVLIVSAPLVMMCYALPATDGIARWWWRAFSACLAIQVVQSLVLITGLKVFLSPGGWSFFGPDRTGMVNVIVALAMGLILIKIPFWLLSALKISPGRGMVSSLVRGVIAYKTFGLLARHGKTAASGKKPAPRGGGDAADLYAKVRATRDGQLMLPLTGGRRGPRPPAPTARIPHAATVPAAAPQNEQLMLPLPQFHGGIDLGPKPKLGRDGQYQLPITVQRTPKPAPPPAAPSPKPVAGARGSRPKQLTFDFTEPDPYASIRPLRNGQYPLPIEARRTPPPRTTNAAPPPTAPAPARRATPPTPPPPAAPALSRSAGRQLHLPLPALPVRRRTRRTPGKGST
ncbi:hypothetical protein [Nocardia brasiliensis]|uniref:hypothetical protein n=1 Tax=Nocardia brasiliensis TaxID=37326 RepID=UPI00366AB891